MTTFIMLTFLYRVGYVRPYIAHEAGYKQEGAMRRIVLLMLVAGILVSVPALGAEPFDIGFDDRVRPVFCGCGERLLPRSGGQVQSCY